MSAHKSKRVAPDGLFLFLNVFMVLNTIRTKMLLSATEGTSVILTTITGSHII